MKNYLFIINPVSGKGKGKKFLPKIESYLKNSGINFDIIITEFQGHATKIVSENYLKYDFIISVGGDGTLNEIINGIDPGASLAFGVIPIGSGNDFALSLNMPKELLKSLDVIIDKTKIMSCDLCELKFTNNDNIAINKRFINNFGLGFDAQVAFINQHKKIGRGIVSYIIAVLRALFDYNPINYTLIFEDMTIKGEKLLLTFGNGTSSGGGFYLTPNAKIDDNLLDITTIEFIGRLKLLQKLPLALINKMETVIEAKMYKSNSAVVDIFGDIYIHTDGEAAYISTNKIIVSVLDKKIRFITNQ